MASKIKKPRGRPSKFNDQICKQAAKLCKLGATDAQLADFFEVNRDTIAEWKKTYSQFSDTLKRTKEEADALVEKSLFQRARGYKHKAIKIMQYEGVPVLVPYIERYAPDTTACIFWLKNRKPDEWGEKDPDKEGQKEEAPPSTINLVFLPKPDK